MKEFKIEKKKNIFLIYFSFLLLYIILGELTPILNFLPKPQILLDSFFSLWTDYNLLAELGITTFTVYVGIFLGVLILEITSGVLVKFLSSNKYSLELFKFLKYFPAFFFAILFSFWFPDSIIAQLVFVVLAFVSIMFVPIQNALKNVNESYVDSALSYKVSESKLSKIIWKDSQPKIYSNLNRIHYYVWTLVMIFEYIGTFNGVGSVYYNAHNYNDYAAFFSLAVLIAFLIWIGDSLIILIKNKLIDWE